MIKRIWACLANLQNLHTQVCGLHMQRCRRWIGWSSASIDLWSLQQTIHTILMVSLCQYYQCRSYIILSSITKSLPSCFCVFRLNRYYRYIYDIVMTVWKSILERFIVSIKAPYIRNRSAVSSSTGVLIAVYHKSPPIEGHTWQRSILVAVNKWQPRIQRSSLKTPGCHSVMTYLHPSRSFSTPTRSN